MKNYTRRQLATLFNVQIETVRKWEQRGKLTADFHINNRPRYNEHTIEKMKAENKKSEPITLTLISE